MSAETSGDFADSRPDGEVGDNFYDPHNLVKALPHEVGLTPLGCGRCGRSEIFDHPCPECDYAPGRDDAQQSLSGWSE